MNTASMLVYLPSSVKQSMAILKLMRTLNPLQIGFIWVPSAEKRVSGKCIEIISRIEIKGFRVEKWVVKLRGGGPQAVARVIVGDHVDLKFIRHPSEVCDV